MKMSGLGSNLLVCVEWFESIELLFSQDDSLLIALSISSLNELSSDFKKEVNY